MNIKIEILVLEKFPEHYIFLPILILKINNVKQCEKSFLISVIYIIKPTICVLAEKAITESGVDEGGLTLLHWAADRGFTDIADHILKINPSIINNQVIVLSCSLLAYSFVQMNVDAIS